MCEQSTRLRERAGRADGLAWTISDMDSSRTLRRMARKLTAQADEMEALDLVGSLDLKGKPHL